MIAQYESFYQQRDELKQKSAADLAELQQKSAADLAKLTTELAESERRRILAEEAVRNVFGVTYSASTF